MNAITYASIIKDGPADEARDEHGRWTSGGGAGLKALGDQAITVKHQWVKESKFKTIEQAIAHAPANQKALGDVGRQIAAARGVTFKDPGVKSKSAKGIEQITVKANAGRGPGGVTDIVRSAFVVDTPKQTDMIVNDLSKHFQVVAEGWRQTPLGYVDRTALVRFKDGQIGEVQMMRADMAAAKSPDVGGGHDLYAQSRGLPNGDPTKIALEAKQHALYQGVVDHWPAEWKAVLGKSGSLGKRDLNFASDISDAPLPISDESASRHAPSRNNHASPGAYRAANPSNEQNSGTAITYKYARGALKARTFDQVTRGVDKFDPGEARDGHGRWTSGGAGYEFVSPNVGTDSRFGNAVQAINGNRQRHILAAGAAVDRALGMKTSTQSGLGAWADGAENTSVSTSEHTDFQALRVAGAMKGYLANQKQVAIFQQQAGGDHVLAHFQATGSLVDINRHLVADGVAFHTLIPTKNGATVYTINMDPSSYDATVKAAGRYGTTPTAIAGKAEFIGTTRTSGSDGSQRADARAIYQGVIGSSASARIGPSTVGQSWARLRNSSGTPYAKIDDAPATGGRAMAITYFELIGKDDPGIDDVHVATALGNEKRARSYKQLRKKPVAKLDSGEFDWAARCAIEKTDAQQNLVFGWANVIQENGTRAEDLDTQGDVISEGDLEAAFYDFAINARKADEMHDWGDAGDMVECMVFTKEKQRVLGIDLGRIGAWVGFRVRPDVFAKVKSGEYRAFSIGGRGRRVPLGA